MAIASGSYSPPSRRSSAMIGLTGSVSGSASPHTRYGSFPPTTTLLLGEEVSARLRAAERVVPEEDRAGEIDGDVFLSARGRERERHGKGKDKGRRIPEYRRIWSQSSETVCRRGADDVGVDDLESEVVEQSDSTLLGPDGEQPARAKARSRVAAGPSASVPGDDSVERQYGVVKMEIITKYWSKQGLWTIYAGVYLISVLTSLEANTTPTIEPYFLSLLGSHSFLSGIAIVTNIAYAVGAAPISKILDVFGRGEGVLFSLILYALGFVLTACSTDVPIFVIARATSAFAGQGLQLAQQIIVADTSGLDNRALITSTISLPWLVTVWLGPVLGGWLQGKGERGYRVAYILFGILTPLAAAVLVIALATEWRRIKRRFSTFSSRVEGESEGEEDVAVAWKDKRRIEVKEEWVVKTFKSSARTVWRDLDIVGLTSLTLGCSLILIPLTLTAFTPGRDPSIYLLILLGAAVICFFVHHEINAPYAVLPARLLRNRSVLAGSALGYFHYCSQFIYQSFLTSFLQVARGYTPRDASYISQSYLFSASIAAIVAGILTKYTRRYRWVGVLGVIIHFAGIALMMRARRLESSNFELLISQLIAGVGGGFTTIAAQVGVQAAVTRQDVAISTAVFLTITQIGGACGGALAGLVWSSLLPSRLARYLPLNSDPELIGKIMASLPYALSFAEGSPIRVAINLSYVDVQQTLNRFALSMVFPALIAMLTMSNTVLTPHDDVIMEGVVVLGSASFLEAEHETDTSTSSETNSLLEH